MVAGFFGGWRRRWRGVVVVVFGRGAAGLWCCWRVMGVEYVICFKTTRLMILQLNKIRLYTILFVCV